MEKTEFEIISLQQGKGSIFVLVEGFLSDTKYIAGTDVWVKRIREFDKDAQILKVNWKAGVLHEMILDGVLNSRFDLANPNQLVLSIGGSLSKTIIREWYRAKNEADRVGEGMCGRAKNLKSMNKTFLVGHSLGGRIILKMLESMAQKNIPNRFKGIYIFGSAIGEDEINHASINKAITKNIYNFFSKQDGVLASSFHFSRLIEKNSLPFPYTIQDIIINLPNLSNPEKAIGLAGMKQLKIKNIDLSNEVKSHFQYAEKTSIIKRYI